MRNGRPLFNKTDYPLVSVVDKLLNLPGSSSGDFNILVWADNRNRIVTEPRGRTFLEYEVGYSSKEEAFINEFGERGQRWRYEKVFYDSDVAKWLQKKDFDALVIIGEDIRTLAHKAVIYLDKIPQGPKTVIMGFPKRDLDSSYLYGVWSYLRSRHRLHLMKNFAYLNSSKSNPKYLPIVFEDPTIDLSVPIWKVEPEQITEKHIINLFQTGVHEGQHLDYKRADCLKKGKTGDLLKDMCAMANKGGGIILLGIKETDGRPLMPISLGLQGISKPDKELTRLGQIRTSAFGTSGPEVSTGFVEVRQKFILYIKVFDNVGAPMRPPPTKPGDDRYPFRDNQMTAWVSLK